MSAPAPVVSTGAAAAAPGGALHFGMGLRARYAGPARSRPAALAGLPFATLGRRMAPSPLAAPRPAAAGLAWRALGAAPLREEEAPASPRPWRGALGQAPAAPPVIGGEAQLGGFDAGGFDAPLPELLPAGSSLVGRDPGAPFHPLPQAPARPAPAGPASHGESRTGGGPAIGGGSADVGGSEGGGSADGGGMIGSGPDAPRAVPVFPGLPERLVPAWAMGGGEGPGSAGSHLPRVPSPLPPGTSLADLAGPARSDGGMADGALPLPARAPQLSVPTPNEAVDGPGDGSSAPAASWGGGDGGMDDATPLTWASPATGGDARGGGSAAADAGRSARDGGRAAAEAESRAFADAVGFTPLSWPTPAPGGGEPDTTAQLPRLAWAETGGGASTAVAVPPGETQTGEPGPYAPTLLHGITLAAQLLATAVERRETVREARREAQEAARPAPAPAPLPPPPVDPTSDEVVRTLMRKMTAMAREERFRAGGLR